jgi:psp operon transcriptional activator
MPERDSIQINEDQGSARQEIHEAIGQSDSFLAFQERLSKVAQVNRPVLLMGERGTGKELAAQRLHFLSRRWEGPFLALNCSALSSTLLESELFGHEAGAFTGAGSRRQGRFETASGGTLFLDEIGNIPLETQAKILRVVEYGSFERVGSSQSIEVDVRIVGATNANLKSLADSGRFLTDLLDRLSFEVLVLPPLRDRLEDIAILSNHFAARMGFELGWDQIPEVTEEAMKMMERYEWPGNVRELKNVIERAVYRSDDYVITKEELEFDPFRAYLASHSAPGEAAMEEGPAPPTGRNAPAYSLATSFQDQLKQLEAGLVETALEESKFNQKKAAELLGLTYHQFRGLYRKYQESPESGA